MRFFGRPILFKLACLFSIQSEIFNQPSKHSPIMKITVISILLLFSSSFCYAQLMPESVFGMLPDPPGGICNAQVGENPAKKAFIDKTSEIDQQLDKEILARHNNLKDKMDQNEDKMMHNAMDRTGISPELMQQMMALQKKSKGASGEQAKAYNAQKKALAGQMMEQSTNLSMGEIENLKNMDKAGKKAWAEAYATEKKAEIMADPKAYQDKNAALMKDVKLVQKQQHLADSLGSQLTKYMKQFADLDVSREAQDLLTQIKEAEAQLDEMYKEGNNKSNEQINGQLNKIRNLQINYCNMQTPKYLAILSNYKVFLHSSIPHFYRLEKMTNQLTASQTGVDVQASSGLMGLEKIRDYLQKLKGSYQYNQIRPEAKYIGAE